MRAALHLHARGRAHRAEDDRRRTAPHLGDLQTHLRLVEKLLERGDDVLLDLAVGAAARRYRVFDERHLDAALVVDDKSAVELRLVVDSQVEHVAGAEQVLLDAHRVERRRAVRGRVDDGHLRRLSASVLLLRERRRRG